MRKHGEKLATIRSIYPLTFFYYFPKYTPTLRYLQSLIYCVLNLLNFQLITIRTYSGLSMFKQCNNCQKFWNSYEELLADPDVKIIGYQVSFEELEAGLFLFNHSCNNTFAIKAEDFTHLNAGPIFKERATGTEQCPGYCLNDCELRPCPAHCECAYVRDVIQAVKEWPKVD
jgi:hypothetical protein